MRRRCEWANPCEKPSTNRVHNITANVILHLCDKHLKDYLVGIEMDTTSPPDRIAVFKDPRKRRT